MSPLEALVLRDIRSEIIPSARNDVLEAGIGTGANARYYDYENIHMLTGLDRQHSPELERRYPKGTFAFVPGDIEQMPFDAGSFDCVVATLVLCTAAPEKSLREIRRVLKPGGRFLFIEHVRPSGAWTGKLVDACNGLWSRMAGGCNLNRRTGDTLINSGFADMCIQQRCNGVFIYGFAIA